MERPLLAQAAIFSELDAEELERVAAICGTRILGAGEYVFREGDEGDRLYIIAKGEVRISRDIPGAGEEAITVLKPGACFGEMAVLDRSTRSTHAIVNERCSLITIARGDFEQLLDDDRDLAYKLLWSVVRLLSQRLRMTNDNLRTIMVMAMF